MLYIDLKLICCYGVSSVHSISIPIVSNNLKYKFQDSAITISQLKTGLAAIPETSYNYVKCASRMTCVQHSKLRCNETNRCQNPFENHLAHSTCLVI